MSDSQITSWMEQYGWEENPFNFRIYPDLMIGYEDRYQRLVNGIESRSKLTLLVGETGAGKTNMLRSIETAYQDQHLFYMSKPPVTEADLLAYLRDEIVQPGFIARRIRSYSLYNIHEAVNKRYDGQIVLLVDEGHEASTEVLEWLRTALDHIDQLTVIAAGLPSFEGRLQEEVNTLYSRATDVVQLESLDRDDTIELIRKRIEQVGGSSTEPFTQSAILKIYEQSGGFPRDVLRLCHECVVAAADEGKAIIDVDDVPSRGDEGSRETNTESDQGERNEEALSRLTAKQRTVFNAVASLDEATSGEVVDHIGLEDYKTRSHAIRSINNILRRLMEQELVTRERVGRNYLYRPAS